MRLVPIQVECYAGFKADERPRRLCVTGRWLDVAEVSDRGYSPPQIASVTRYPLIGSPDLSRISTSHVERQSLTMRMQIRRLTRLTNAFSKKLDNFKAAVALHFAYYNFVKVHSSLRTTPAMALGVSSRLWTVSDLVEMAS